MHPDQVKALLHLALHRTGGDVDAAAALIEPLMDVLQCGHGTITVEN